MTFWGVRKEIDENPSAPRLDYYPNLLYLLSMDWELNQPNTFQLFSRYRLNSKRVVSTRLPLAVELGKRGPAIFSLWSGVLNAENYCRQLLSGN